MLNSTQRKHDTVIYCAQEMEPLREAMAALVGFDSATVRWKQFKDGFPDLFIEQINAIRGKNVVFMCDFGNVQNIFRQLAVIYVLARYTVKSLTLLLPYFPTATMERVDVEGQVATANTLSRMLGAVPMRTSLIVYDLHALQSRFYLREPLVPRLCSGIPLLKQELSKLPKEEAVCIAFPDEGAQKRFGGAMSGYEIATCHKVLH
jgi:phosphoribosylpyrophosphate synthetase